MDTIFHHILEVLRNVEGALLETLTMGAHVTNNGVHGLVERL
jgi:hypothetical protein